MRRILQVSLLSLMGALLSLGLFTPAWGQQPLIKQIDIRGNQRVESEAIRQRIATRVGDVFSPEKVRGDVEGLFKMGFFDDVTVEAEEFEGGLRLIYLVKEKPIIRSIQIDGVKELSEQDIRDRIDIAAGTVFNPPAVGRNAEKIRLFYEEEGYYTAKVEGSSRKVTDREVDVIFQVEEGTRFFVRDIRFIGNKGLSRGDISKVMATKERFFIPFLRPGVLKRSDLNQDVERIKALYLDHGYLQVKVEEPEIQVDRKASRLDLVIRIEEGPQFRLGKVGVTGNTVFPTEELLETMKLPKQKVFSRDVLRKDIVAITEKYSEVGYVFVDVVPVTQVKAEEKIVDVTMEVTEGIKTFVERIEIRGNTKTRDKVIRRHFELVEGEVYNGKLLQEARRRIQRLGYFEEVRIGTARGSAPEQLILGVDVKERPTGRLGFGAGFSTTGGAVGSVFLGEDNVFGLGKRIRLQATFGQVTSIANLRYDDPFFLDSNYSFSLNIFNRFSTFSEFNEERRGAEVGFGRRFLKYNSVSLSYLYERVEISEVDDDASQLLREAEGTSATSSINLGIARDTRDDPTKPTTGYRVSLNNELAGGPLGADNDFYKFILDAAYHLPLLTEQELTLMIRGRGGFVNSYSDTDRVPLQERFFLGGPTSFRGANFRKLSPKDPVTGERIGGNKFSLFTTEVGMPILKDFVQIGGVIFIDAANNIAQDKSFDTDFEYAFGVGAGVITPFGPIRIDVAYNPNPRADDDNIIIHFNVGRSF